MSKKTITKFQAVVMSAIFFGLTVVYYNMNKKESAREARVEQLEQRIQEVESRLE